MAMSSNLRRLAPLAVLMLVGGCDHVYPNGSTDPSFGETARYNAEVQTIDPEPKVAQGAAMPGDNGAIGAAAAKRYRTDTVKKIERVQTSTDTTSSGGQ